MNEVTVGWSWQGVGGRCASLLPKNSTVRADAPDLEREVVGVVNGAACEWTQNNMEMVMVGCCDRP
jgi:hypothetical protein